MENEIVIFETEDNAIKLKVPVECETVWLNRQQMSELFDRDVKTIGKHINNALREELEDQVVVAKFATTTQHGAIEGKTQTHMTEYYNLDVIISVGYRVKSKRGVEFRRWANSVLKKYILQGYAVNDNRIAQLGEVIRIMKRTQNALDSQQVLNVIQKYKSCSIHMITRIWSVLKEVRQHMNSHMRSAKMLFLRCDLEQNQICSAKRKTIHSKVVLETYISPFLDRNCIRH